jgi:tetratricopeptide (TPR) repeat protein
VVNDPAKTLEAYKDWTQVYPRDTIPLDNTSLIYSSMGQHEKAVEAASEALRLDPNDRYAYANLAGSYEGLNRFDEARSVAEQAVARKLDSLPIHFVLSDLAYIRGDWVTYEHEIGWANGTSGEPIMLFFKGAGLAARGKVKASREFMAQGRTELLRAGVKEFAALMFADDAYANCLTGNLAAGRQTAEEALSLSQDREARSFAAESLALSGDVTKAEAVMKELSLKFPDNERLRQVLWPRVMADSALQENKPKDALAALESLRSYELGTGPTGVGVEPIYLRGQAYLKLHDGAKAAAEFQRILDHRGAAVWDPEYPLARLNLGRAYVLQGDTAKARTAYQDFFAAWKDADADLPVLKDAKAEYEKLK